MTPIEAMAKAIGKASWHNDPERPFTDEVWEREVRWWRDPDNKIIRETFFADKCFRQARAALLALAEVELPEAVTNAAGAAIYASWASAEPRNDSLTAFRAIIRSLAEGGEA
jgi:hypothetical protein